MKQKVIVYYGFPVTFEMLEYLQRLTARVLDCLKFYDFTISAIDHKYCYFGIEIQQYVFGHNLLDLNNAVPSYQDYDNFYKKFDSLPQVLKSMAYPIIGTYLLVDGFDHFSD